MKLFSKKIKGVIKLLLY